MPLVISVNNKETVKVICRHDSTITKLDGYQDYLDSFKLKDGPKEDHLGLKPGEEPTRFILRRTIPFQQKQQIRGTNLTVEGADIKMSVNYATDLIRAALIDVKNPGDDGLRVKRGRDGLVDGEYINMLEESGVLADLTNAYLNVVGQDDKEHEGAKKS